MCASIISILQYVIVIHVRMCVVGRLHNCLSVYVNMTQNSDVYNPG